MFTNEKKNISRFLSLVLRHRPELIKIDLDKNGWGEVKQLLHKINIHSKKDFIGIITTSDLEEIVRDNDKQRFAFNDDKTMIRANQGHSIKVDLELKAVRPPDYLFHGTAISLVPILKKEGLKKMNRQHVHLSELFDTAYQVGRRKGKHTVLVVDTASMFSDGYKFYKSENGVWLIDTVPPKYLFEK